MFGPANTRHFGLPATGSGARREASPRREPSPKPLKSLASVTSIGSGRRAQEVGAGTHSPQLALVSVIVPQQVEQSMREQLGHAIGQ